MAYRRNGYYYRSYRDGSRVRTEYLGAGELGAISADLHNEESARHKAERAKLQANRQAEKEHERHLDTVGDFIRAITRATLIINGYHTNKGTWHRSRKWQTP